MYPTDLKYSQDHEWIRIEGDTGQIGITDYAQDQLGDVVYIELPTVGESYNRGDQFGSIESVKAVSDLFCPVSGEVVDVNQKLADTPEAVNKSPHDTWMIVVRLTKPEEVEALHDAEAYTALVS